MSSQDKRVFMELGDGSEFESLKKTATAAKDEIKDFALDEALENLFSKIEIDINQGMATIAMPLQALKILSKFAELLKPNEMEISR